jgi:hypothetical protein
LYLRGTEFLMAALKCSLFRRCSYLLP